MQERLIYLLLSLCTIPALPDGRGIHLIWRTRELNGKETPQGCFLKYTAHEFRTILLNEGSDKLSLYKIDAENKKHEFWQRDSLAIHLYSRETAFQKLKYIHNNPLAEQWQLVKPPCDYKYSLAQVGSRPVRFF